jgi:uncharacterized protein involved in type VI secretion and phage assembly
MPGELMQFGQDLVRLQREKKVEGIATATVIANCDSAVEGRVQIRLPWMPGYEPWARVATPMAGMGYGTFFIPQPGDEVLVAFNKGDVREPYVIGSLWNTRDRPPAGLPTDAVTKRTIRTPSGQEVAFDESSGSVTIRNTSLHSLALDPKQAQLKTAEASVTLDVTGKVTITAAKELKIEAPVINISGTKVVIKGTASATIDGGKQCSINAGQVDIC